MLRKISGTLLVGLCVFVAGCDPDSPGPSLLKNSGQSYFLEGSVINVHEFSVVMDYNKSIEELIEKCGCVHVDSIVNNANLPKKGGSSSKIKIELIRFQSDGDFLTGANICFLILKRGYRPATAHELLSLRAEHKNEDLTRVVALGSTINHVGGLSVMTLTADAPDNATIMVWPAGTWTLSYWWFAAVKTEPSIKK